MKNFTVYDWMVALLPGPIFTLLMWGLIYAIQEKGIGSSEAAAWVQAAGSIAALGVAVFVMSRQNAHAAKLVIDADKRALKRRAAAVSAIIERAHAQINNVFNLISTAAAGQSEVFTNVTIQNGRRVLNEMQKTVRSIPAYELGSYEAVVGLQKTIETINDFDKTAEQWVSSSPPPREQEIIFQIQMLSSNAKDAKEIFSRGVSLLEEI